MTEEELLVQIHNQLVDLKKLLVEIEIGRPDTPATAKTRLQQIADNAKHIKADGSTADATATHQLVITPTDQSIQPGEGNPDQK